MTIGVSCAPCTLLSTSMTELKKESAPYFTLTTGFSFHTGGYLRYDTISIIFYTDSIIIITSKQYTKAVQDALIL
jgi:hypothetical protein